MGTLSSSNLTRTLQLNIFTSLPRIIKNAMMCKYLLIIVSIILLSIFSQQLPFAYPHLLCIWSVILAGNIILHILLLQKKIIRWIDKLIILFYAAATPLVVHFSGGFLSPFVLLTLLTSMCDRTVLYHQGKDVRYLSPILILGYISIALLQKYHVLPNCVPYSNDMMQHTILFYSIVVLTSLQIFGGLYLLNMLNTHTSHKINEIGTSFKKVLQVTTAVIDKNFFINLAQYCSELLNVRCICVAEYLPCNSTLCTLAIWDHGRCESNFCLPLTSTLAHIILKSPEAIIIDQKIIKEYPDDPLATLFSDGFIYGCPLRDSCGNAIGVFFACHDHSLPIEQFMQPFVSAIVLGVAVELERKITKKNSEKRMQLQSLTDKMQALGKIAGSLAHDFNNIISAISGYASLLKKRLPPDNRNYSYLDHILEAGKHASGITSQLSMLVKNDTPKIGPIDVGAAINTVVSRLQEKYGATVQITVDCTPQPPVYISGEYQLFENVLMNLGINAYDACTANGAIISFSTSQVFLDKQNILCQSLSISEGDYICITVNDNGCGMSSEVLTHIFEPFFTTKPKDKGVGLGLANTWRYIRTYQGAIDVTSVPEKGSTFFLYLPLYKNIEKSPDFSTSSLTEFQSLGHTILIVDDEPSVRDIYSDILIDNGYTVYTSANGREALDFIRNGKISVDLVLLDMVMPEMAGSETFKAIRAIYPGTKVIFMSGLADNEELEKLLDEGDTCFFQKPCDDERLVEYVQTMLSSPIEIDK